MGLPLSYGLTIGTLWGPCIKGLGRICALTLKDRCKLRFPQLLKKGTGLGLDQGIDIFKKSIPTPLLVLLLIV
ncbi:hypothetical protein RHMOL_Rhmol11G0133800 [Rhododendron molle]|uniref:Uncharacterized protein n=1 Tax=Rhododendron molle TaxID=49168 RepID=A0ACC0LS02_RHOML|nr:hypothetical protein RHMOL_Rhmol11G0133800 [Rhododendron molle]